MIHNEKKPINVIRYATVDSTQRVALELGLKGVDQGTVVLADRQTKGKGRLSREFTSPPGGLYVSFILHPKLSTEMLPLVTLAAGTAFASAIGELADVQVKLKWPNDLYCEGKKIGGILTEAGPYSTQKEAVSFVVVGVGVNINTKLEEFPHQIRSSISSLHCITGRVYSIDALLHISANALFAEISLLQSNPDQILDKWQACDFLLGKHLTWHDPQGQEICGIGKGLLPDGRYLLTTSGGDDYPVLAGDIFITKINGQDIK